MICSNCEFSEAIVSCENCPIGQCTFCNECSKIHLKVKAFRQHRLSPLKSVVRNICSNCDTAEAIHACKNCPKEENLFCQQCSQLHLKIKKFRSHQLGALSNLSILNTGHNDIEYLTYSSDNSNMHTWLSLDNILHNASEGFDSFVDSCRRFYLKAIDDNDLGQSSTQITAVALVAFMLAIRLTLGRNAAVFVVILGLVFFRFYWNADRQVQVDINRAVASDRPAARSDGWSGRDSRSATDFSDEFPHTKPPSPDRRSASGLNPIAPAFRARGRAYKGRSVSLEPNNMQELLRKFGAVKPPASGAASAAAATSST